MVARPGSLRLDIGRDGWTIVDPAAVPSSTLAGTDVTLDTDGREIAIERPWLSRHPVFVRPGATSVRVSTDWESLVCGGAASLDVGYVKDYLRFQAPLTRR